MAVTLGRIHPPRCSFCAPLCIIIIKYRHQHLLTTISKITINRIATIHDYFGPTSTQGVKVEVLERKFHFGEADVALFTHGMTILWSTKEKEVCVFEINDTDALHIGLAASVSRMISPVTADLMHTRIVSKLTPYEVFDLNAIFAQVVKGSPSAWVAATSVVSFVCARIVPGNDYKERKASDAKSVLEAYLQQVHEGAAHDAPALASASWHQESRTATVIFEEEAIKAFI